MKTILLLPRFMPFFCSYSCRYRSSKVSYFPLHLRVGFSKSKVENLDLELRGRGTEVLVNLRRELVLFIAFFS